MKLTKTIGITSLLFTGFLLFFTSSVTAATYRSGDNVNIPEGTVISETLFAGGETVVIDGTVDGDLFCGGQRVRINGRVNGDVICGGQSIEINGPVSGDVRIGGQTITLNGSVGQNVMTFGQQVEVGPNAVVNGEYIFGAQEATILGKVNKSLSGGGQDITLNGSVGKNVDLQVENVMIGEGAVVGGTMSYTSDNKAQIAQGSQIRGNVNQTVPEKGKREYKTPKHQWNEWNTKSKAASILTHLLIALVLILVSQKRVRQTVEIIGIRVGPSIGIGFLILVLTPIVMILFFITVIGIPIGLMVLLAYILALVISRIFVGLFIGQKILDKFYTPGQKNTYLSAVIGIPVTWLVFNIPVIGWLFSFVALLWGLGGIYYFIRPPGEALESHEVKKHKTKKS